MQDGLVLMYVKDGVVYPVALTEEEYATLQMLGQVFNPVTVITDKPQGEALNLTRKKINSPTINRNKKE